MYDVILLFMGQSELEMWSEATDFTIWSQCLI